MEYISP